MRRGLLHDDDGVAAVEFALMLPFFVIFVFGSLDAAYLWHQSHRVEQGLELAASYLSKAPDPDAVRAQARSLAVTGALSGGTARVKGWRTSDVRINVRTLSGDWRGGARVVSLTSEHDYKGFGFLNAVTRQSLKVRASHEERIDA